METKQHANTKSPQVSNETEEEIRKDFQAKVTQLSKIYEMQ